MPPIPITPPAGWAMSDQGRAMEKKFIFKDFAQAFGFMTQVALAAERQDHHPEWSNVWNKVSVRLSTHDAGCVTDKDIRLAKAIDDAAGH